LNKKNTIPPSRPMRNPDNMGKGVMQQPRRPQPEKKLTPMPIGDRCNTLCPLFKCTRNALFIFTRIHRGKNIKEAYCRLTGDKCVGFECQYSSCKINAILPDGRCNKAIEHKYRTISDEELFKEMKEYIDLDAEDYG